MHPGSLDLYFQGQAWWNKGPTPECMLQARRFFERAIALDAGNVEAMVGLALVDATTGAALMTDSSPKFFAAAETTLKKALSLASNHAYAHLVLGLAQMYTKGPAQGRVRAGIDAGS